MENILIYGIPAIAVVMGLTEVAKRWIGVNSRWAPLISIGLGIVVMLLIPSIEWREAIVKGLCLGLTTSGLWSGFKATVLKK